MGEGIKLTLGDDPEITDSRCEEPSTSSDSGTRPCVSYAKRRPRETTWRRFQLRSGGRASLQDYGWPTHTGRHSAGKTAHGALHLFRDWPTLWHSRSTRRTV